MSHVPVLLKETIEILNPQPGEFFIDGTIGSGGHAAEILRKIGPKGKLLGIDWDNESLKRFELKVESLKSKGKIILANRNYADLPEILQSAELRRLNADKRGTLKADGLLLDLGFSSESLGSGRGFTFQKNEPLDMRYNMESISISQFNNQHESAAAVISNRSEKDLAEIFWKYGEERFSRQIARKIIEERKIKPIKTTFDLVEIIKKSIPKNYERSRIHPATKVFQALRIYVNHELENLEKLLSDLEKIIKNKPSHLTGISAKSANNKSIPIRCGGKGRTAIISYHSLEDRLVKNYFRELKNQGKAEILTKKPIRPTNEEIQANPRSRSAKLRAVEML